MIKLYFYDEKTKEFNGMTIELIKEEDAGTSLPYNRTALPVPETQENQIAVFKGNKWVVRQDYRKMLRDVEEKYKNLIAELEASDYIVRRLYEYENGYDSDPEKEAEYKERLRIFAVQRKNLKVWEREAEELKAIIASLDE